MKTRALLLLGLLGSGCMIVPKKVVTTTPGANEHGASTFAKLARLELTTRTTANVIHVGAIRRGECIRPLYAVSEVKTERKAKLGGTDDPRTMVFGVLLAPVLIPVSAVVTGLMLAGDDVETTKQTHLLGTEHYPCTQPADGLAVMLTLPSGTILTGTTNARGDASVEVPDTEAYAGVAQLTAQGAEAQDVSYSLPRPAVTVARDAVTLCAKQAHLSGSIELKVSIDEAGNATQLWLSVGDSELNRCVTARLSGQRFPSRMWDHTIRMPLAISAR